MKLGLWGLSMREKRFSNWKLEVANMFLKMSIFLAVIKMAGGIK